MDLNQISGLPNVCAPQVIIFDWDGVLVDTKNLISGAYAHVFDELGQKLFPIDEAHQLPGTSLREYFPKIFGDRAPHAEKVFYEYVLTNHLNLLKKMDGAQEVLEYLHSHNFLCSVVSNKRGDILRQEVQFLGWEKFFHRVVGSKDCVKDKPDPITVFTALEGINGYDCRDVWFVGDWLADLECAHRAKVVSVLINNPNLYHQKDLPYPPDFYINDCQELKKFLIQLYLRKKG